MEDLSRRRALELLIASGAYALVGCSPEPDRGPRLGLGGAGSIAPPPTTGADAIVRVEPLTTPWQTRDPFLFCMHHDDRYPAGNAQLGPAASLAGHRMGQDFEGVDGWRMYHGDAVPGFPRHPHRGFETVTVVRRGLLDHSDSLGATARYGRGDVQWLTAGRGIQHAEMFPLLRADGENPLELFQIWLNLPATHKMVDPHFSMLWQPTIPTREVVDEAGRRTRVTVVAGRYDDATAPAPPPRSWASEADHHVAIWSVALEPHARFTLPAAPRGVNRSLYYFDGSGLAVGGQVVPDVHHVVLQAESDVALAAAAVPSEVLVLQGRPIGEPVARHGPFVMNTDAEIARAYSDYRQTQFGGWPWPSPEPVHPRTEDRFALRPGGVIETPSRT
ncbi:MAG: pirin family protein [Sandaracinaceae bacterium]|nr:pirin family protein [Sandaracinaceae bacterium]